MASSIQDDVAQLVIAVFRLNGALLEAGDELTASLGLTSARWQVMGALALNDVPLTIPRIAEYMGVSRQAVLKQIKLLVDKEFVEQLQNASHKRSDHWRLTPLGYAQYEQIMALHRIKAHEWRKGLSHSQLKDCAQMLGTMLDSIKLSKGKTP